MKRFLTLFLKTENIHLTKDVGMIPYFLQKEHDYNSTIACYKNGRYTHLEEEIKGVHLVFVKKIFYNEFLDSLLFLLFNAAKYDILQFYHLSKFRSFLAFVFKLFAKKGAITYFKLDADESILEFRYKGLIGYFFLFLVKKIDIISIETKELYNRLRELNLLKRPVEYIPNGYFQRYEMSHISKEKLFLTVGRIGTYQKNTEVLLQAFEKFSQTDNIWQLEIVGPIDAGFEPYIRSFFNNHPNLQERIKFTGMVTDKKVLASIYERASVFVLTSRYESFGLVYLEALQAGCYILSTDLIPAHDVTDGGKYGEIFPVGDVNKLSELLIKSAANSAAITGNITAIKTFAKDNFSWSVIVNKLDKIFKNERV